MERQPLISVVLPTFRRPELLRRAIASVQSQTFTDWELVISDDERPGGEAFAEAVALSAKDPRVRVVRNPREPGQANNLNHACSVARGRWIKPLYDDDALKPECLREFSKVAEKAPSAAMISCRADRFIDGKPRSTRAARPVTARVLPRNAVHLSMLMQDVQTGTPVQVMIPRSIYFDRGVRFPKSESVVSGVDTLWNAEILMHGDLVEIMSPLVDQHQGSHATITSSMTPEALFGECRDMRRHFWDRVPADARDAGFLEVAASRGVRRVRVPSLDVALALQKLIHVAAMARRHRLASLAATVGGVATVSAWPHFVRWIRQQRDPVSNYYVPRVPLAT